MKHTPNKDCTVPFVITNPKAEGNEFAEMLASGKIDEKFYQELVEDVLDDQDGPGVQPGVQVIGDILETYGPEVGMRVLRERFAKNIAVFSDILVIGIINKFNLQERKRS